MTEHSEYARTKIKIPKHGTTRKNETGKEKKRKRKNGKRMNSGLIRSHVNQKAQTTKLSIYT